MCGTFYNKGISKVCILEHGHFKSGFRTLASEPEVTVSRINPLRKKKKLEMKKIKMGILSG